MTTPLTTRNTALAVCLSLLLLAGCASPSVEDVPGPTATVPIPTETTAPPTAAVGQTVGSACESGKLRFADLTAMDEGWRDGLAIARGRALGWQKDAVLVELRVACELFEPGFRWQATYYSRGAQAYYSTDTAETVPVEIDPRDVLPLPEEEIRFQALRDLLATNGYDDADPAIELGSLRLVMTSDAARVGPPTVPSGHAVAHLSILGHGQSVELYVDLTAGGLYRYGEE